MNPRARSLGAPVCWQCGGIQWKVPPFLRRITLADDKLYKAEYHGAGTFTISKPKRKEKKRNQTKVKNPQRGARRG